METAIPYQRSTNHRALRPLSERLTLRAATWHARGILARFFREAEDATAVQERVLLEKLHRNAQSDFGNQYGFDRIRSYADFARQVPVLRYEDLEPYIEKVMAGHERAMFGPRQKVHMFARTSGTTDRPKYIPVTTPFLKEYRRGWNAFGVRAIMDHPGCMLRHIVQIASPMDEERSTGGYNCGAITGLIAANQKRLVRKYYAVPIETAYITDPVARYYTAMRFAIPNDVAFMITASPATQLKLVRTADAHCEELIRDIRDGAINRQLRIDRRIRAALEQRLQPDPETARRLSLIAQHSGRLLPKDYWNLGFLANWTGGTMRLYLHEFEEFFGDTPVRDVGLLASEGRSSIPIEDGTPSGILDVGNNFYEFIPTGEYENSKPTVLRAHELEVGEEYFILLTTSAGFYRYDIGDCVRVTGHHAQAPLIEFLHKGAHVCSLTGEKLTEQQVVLAFDQAANSTAAGRPNFVLTPRWGDVPGYVLHIEHAHAVDRAAYQALTERFERALCEVNFEYQCKRKSKRLKSVQANLLPQRWLTELDRRMSQRHHQANEQYKHRYLYARLGEDQSFPMDLLKPQKAVKSASIT